MTTERAVKPTQAGPPSADWKLEAGEGTLNPKSALDVLTNLNERVAQGSIDDLVPIATGFVPMDKSIGGGLRPGELMLIGGAQGQDVVFHRVIGNGHAWPGGKPGWIGAAKPTSRFDATEEIWRFFAAHARR